MSGYIFTPPPTPPKRSHLSFNSPPLSPPDSPLSIFTSYPTHLNPAYRSRCNSEKTLNNNELLFENNKGFEKIGGAEKEVRVEVKVKIGLGETRESLQRKIELAFIENEEDTQEEEGGKGVVAEKSEVEREQGDEDKIHLQEEELRILRCKLKRAQQSIHDLRRNNTALKMQTSESLAIAHQSEQDLERVLKVLKLTREHVGVPRGGGGGSWIVVFSHSLPSLSIAAVLRTPPSSSQSFKIPGRRKIIMGRDRLDRIGSRQANQSQALDSSRVEKAQMVTIEKLRERREAREVEDLRAEVVLLQKQLANERDKLEQEKKSGKDTDRKVVEKEIIALEKQLNRAKDEIKTITSNRDQLKQELTTLHSQLDSDHRITSLKEELKSSRELAAKRAVQLKSLDEESEIYKLRCKQLEEAANNQTVSEQESREKKKLEDKIEGLEEEITELEFVKTDLTNQLKATKKRVETLEKQIASLEKDNARLVEEKEELSSKEPTTTSNTTSGSVLASLFGGKSSVSSTVNVEKELKKENKHLKENLESLEKRYEVLNKSKGLVANGGEPESSESAPTSSTQRYSQLLENLGLTEDDVSLLLSSGPFWPPYRSSHPDCSVIDHLWQLNDQHVDFEEERQSWEDDKEALEREIEGLKKLVGGEASLEELKKGLEDVGKSQEEIRKLKEEIEEKEKEWESEKGKKEETIAQLEDRITAYEEANPLSNGIERSPSEPRPSSNAGVSSTASQFAMKSMVKTIANLNEELAKVRDENTELLLKLIGAE
ncbi:hypothetical protein JCM5353_003459 [Sporobolomyces roseus]